MRERETKKHIILFDTFEGIPSVSSEDKGFFKKGAYSYSLPKIKEYLGAHDNISFCKGEFPQSAEKYKGTNFSFVHLDVDTYYSTKNSLAFFSSRTSPGSIIVSHDFNIASGVTTAIVEFVKEEKGRVLFLEISSSQCAIVKVRS